MGAETAAPAGFSSGQVWREQLLSGLASGAMPLGWDLEEGRQRRRSVGGLSVSQGHSVSKTRRRELRAGFSTSSEGRGRGWKHKACMLGLELSSKHPCLQKISLATCYVSNPACYHTCYCIHDLIRCLQKEEISRFTGLKADAMRSKY